MSTPTWKKKGRSKNCRRSYSWTADYQAVCKALEGYEKKHQVKQGGKKLILSVEDRSRINDIIIVRDGRKFPMTSCAAF